MQVVFCLKFLPFFNGAIVTEKLRNIDTFSESLKNEQKLQPSGYFHYTTDIETKWKKVFSHHSKMSLPVQNNFTIERWGKLGFITFKE